MSIILERVIFYTLLALLVLVATPYGIINPWRPAVEAIFECVAFILGALWMIEGFLSGTWVTRRHLLLLPLLALVVFAYAQTMPFVSTPIPAGISAPVWQSISYDPYETRLMILKLGAYALVLGMLLRYACSVGRLRILILTIIIIGVASALFAILRQATQRGDAHFLFPGVPLDRGYGQFVNRNHFAFMMEMALGLILGIITGGGGRRERVMLYLAAAIPIWVALVLSNSRGGILSMLCQLLLVVILFGARRIGEQRLAGHQVRKSRLAEIARSSLFRWALGALLLVATFTGVFWIGGEQTASRFEKIPDEVAVEIQESGAGVRRTEIWGATWLMIREHPLMGVGIGGYWTAIPKYHKASGQMSPQQAHNDYLELLAAGGILGISIGAWFLYMVIKFARESLRATDSFRRAASMGAVTGLFGISIHSLVDFGLHIPVNALICLALISIVAASAMGELKNQNTPEH